MESGQRIRLKGKGGPGSNGPNGDLFIRINVEPHAVFGRQGRHLTITVRITWPEAVLGSDVIVPTLDGGNVTLKSSGTPSGQTFRIKGKGVTTSRQTGDLLAKIEVDVPTKLNKKQRPLLKKFQKYLIKVQLHKTPQTWQDKNYVVFSPESRSSNLRYFCCC